MKSEELAEFLSILAQCIEKNELSRLTLSKHRGGDPTLQTISIRPVEIKGSRFLSFVYHHETRDVTENVPLENAAARINGMLDEFGAANMVGGGEEVQLMISRKGKAMLGRRAVVGAGEASLRHDHEKKRFVDVRSQFLLHLGITDANGRVLPSMSAKWKQINVFAELFQRAFAASPLSAEKQVNVVDFGSGKGYLTFAIHGFLSGVPEMNASVTGVEIRGDLVALCNRVVEKVGAQGIRFLRGDVGTTLPDKPHIVVALHACDTATDEAIFRGIESGAALIMSAPCCHKELRPQMGKPAVLEPVLRHGVHLGDVAEMVTDSMRALLLESRGYEVQVFEFISLEHTNKNKMILAIKNKEKKNQPAAAEKMAALKEFFGIRFQRLESLLHAAEV